MKEIVFWATLYFAGQVVITLGFEGDVGKPTVKI